MIYPIGLIPGLVVFQHVLESWSWFILLAIYSVIFQWDHEMWSYPEWKQIPASSPQYETLCNTILFVCHDSVFQTHLFSVNNNILPDISKSWLLWVKVTWIISPGDTFWASVTESLADVKFIMHPSFFGTVIYFSVTTAKKTPLSFPAVVRKLSQKVSHWKSHYQIILQFSSCPEQNYYYIVPPHTLPILWLTPKLCSLGLPSPHPQSWWVPEDDCCSGCPPCPTDALVPTQEYHLPTCVNANWNPILIPLVGRMAGKKA